MFPKHMLTIALALALVLSWLQPAAPVQASAFTVNTTNDSNDGTCNAAHCSLREAILAANDNPGLDMIFFDIPGDGVQTIQPTIPLPTLTDDSGVTINGYSQTGAVPATVTSPAILLIELDGSLLPVSTLSVGIGITSSNNSIKGLVINRFPSDGIAILEQTPGDVASFNYILGNYIGIDPSGVADRGNGLDGVYVGGGASSNWIGGDDPAERNVISGNGWDGVGIWGEYTEIIHVEGNYIGTNATGDAALGNTLDGIYIYGMAHDNQVGVNNTGGAGNLISGNWRNGVRIYGEGSNDNLVAGNWIGLNAGGTAAIPNQMYGVDVTSGPNGSIIGGSLAARRNVISGNLAGGVHIYESGTYQTRVVGNAIGTDPTGTFAIGNIGAGVWIAQTATYSMIGDCSQAGDRNLISGNSGYGVGIIGGSADHNTVECNTIGTTQDGNLPLPNTSDGIRIGLAARNNTLGPWNLIQYNGGDGINLLTSSSEYNTITANWITLNQGKGINLNGVGNNNLAAPTIYAAEYSPATVSGAACGNCQVEVFSSTTPDGEGYLLVGNTTAGPAGDWDVTLPGWTMTQPYLTATTTNADGDTSEFSAIFLAPFYFSYLPMVNH